MVLTEAIARLREEQSNDSANPLLSLPLKATQERVAEQRAELEVLEKSVRSLQQTLPRKKREVELLENELRPMEVQRAGLVAAAREMQQRRDDGGAGHGDDLELKGRWYRNVDTLLRDILQAEA